MQWYIGLPNEPISYAAGDEFTVTGKGFDTLPEELVGVRNQADQDFIDPNQEGRFDFEVVERTDTSITFRALYEGAWLPNVAPYGVFLALCSPIDPPREIILNPIGNNS